MLPSGLHLRERVFCEVQGLPWAILWLFMFSGPHFSQQEWRPWISCGIVWCANGSCGGGSPGCSPASTPSARNAFQVWSKDTAVFPLSMKFSMKVMFKNLWLVLFAMQCYKKRWTEKHFLKPILLQHYFKLINWESKDLCEQKVDWEQATFVMIFIQQQCFEEELHSQAVFKHFFSEWAECFTYQTDIMNIWFS